MIAMLFGVCALATWVACRTAAPAPDAAPAALLLATDAYELHLLDGQVFQLTTDQDGVIQRQPVRTYRRFRELYRVRSGVALPEQSPPAGVEINGWRGLECVRAGQACGRGPEDPTGQAGFGAVRVAWP